MNETVAGIISAIEQGRTDVLRCAITTLENYQDGGDDSQLDMKLDEVLNALLTSDGTLLHMAAKSGQVDITRTLLAAGADPGVHNKDGQTPLDVAADDKIKQVFNEQLLQAVAVSDIGSVCQLIAAGVDVNMLDTGHSKNTPLHWAASYGSKDVIQCLVKRGAKVNVVNGSGATPLHDAIVRGNLEVIEELLLCGADIKLAGTEGKYKGITAYALSENREDILQLMDKCKEPILSNGYVKQTEQGANELNEISKPDSTPLKSPIQNGPLNQKVMNTAINRMISGDNSSVTSPGLSLSSSVTNVSVVTDSRLHLLWPQPAKLLQHQGDPFKPSSVLPIYINDALNKDLTSEIFDVWLQNEHHLQHLNLSFHIETYSGDLPQQQTQILCQINKQLFLQSESYRLTVNKHILRLDASDIAGLHYGITTLIQLLRLCQEDGIPPLHIHDHPSVHCRGVLLDMSKGRVPLEISIRHLIQNLAFLKINQLQLYMRFQVPQDPEVKWQFSYTRSTLLQLERYAKSFGVSLVPVIDVLPGVVFEDLPEIYSSFDQYISCFVSTRILAIGPRLSSFLMDLSSAGDIICDDTKRILPVPARCTVQLCAYMFHDATAALVHFPLNTVLAEYGFQANYDFASHCQKYDENGVPFCLVPGTAAWNSFAGCPEAAVSNIYNAVQAAVTSGAVGVTVSHWSGIGHVTHYPMSLTGIITAAGLCWNSQISLDFIHANLPDLLNVHILEDDGNITGQVILELGRAETYILRCSRNQDGSDNSKLPAEKGTTLFQLLSHPDDVSLEHLTPEIFQKSMRHIRKCQSELEKSKMHCPDGDIILLELKMTVDFMLTACKIGRALIHAGKNPEPIGYKVINPGIANLIATKRTDLANRLLSQIEVYRNVWLHRSLPQGLNESLQTFSSLLSQLIPEGTSNK
ncbi:hypothetical protein LSH36_313g04004 [Paralvinella palmiformis]|uniref:Beta-hexosaminidase bacterial type N-terminal domain-containing protein n=1 Tax=Paralvinella palmiformis TaxID=53620 RepID=A0AAD9JHA9_9ANNE|nr:hypothetical protein LSH36_313g04004 [Paralvinella palmiformis]